MYDIELIINKVRELATKYPAAVYKGHVCSYTKGNVLNGPDREGCIFGQAIIELYPDFDFGEPDTYGIAELIERNNIDCKKIQLDWCDVVQAKQDDDVAWGEALSIADRVS